MEKLSQKQIAGNTLRRLIRENYSSQQEFADAYGLEIRTVSRYVNQGIRDTDIVEELAMFFNISFFDFYTDTGDC